MLEQMNSLLLSYRCEYAAYGLKPGLILLPIGLAMALASLLAYQSYSDTPLPLLPGLIAFIGTGSGGALIFLHLWKYANYPVLQTLRWNRHRPVHSILFSLYYLLTYRQHPAPASGHRNDRPG